jgi:CheY-like chemotaxis protein
MKLLAQESNCGGMQDATAFGAGALDACTLGHIIDLYGDCHSPKLRTCFTKPPHFSGAATSVVGAEIFRKFERLLGCVCSMPNAPSKVLVVDDDATTGMTVAVMLRSAGYEVTTAESGEAALRVMGTREFDLLITDLKMPGIGGMGLIHEVRTRGLLSAGRILVITGEHIASAVCRDVIGLQISLLQKPIRRNELLDAVSAL